MISLQKLAAVAFLLVAASVQVEAQGGGMGGGRGMGGGGGGAEMQARQRAMMFEGITLTEAQTSQVDSIQAATRAKQQEMMQAAMGGGGDRQAMMAQMQEMRATELKAIREILSTEQVELFDKNVAKMPAMGGRGRPPAQR
jgi:Spy/CpxP family protein refolding chaperone